MAAPALRVVFRFDPPLKERPMRSPNLRLTVTREGFSITPLPAQVESRCTFDHGCSQRASHRLLINQPTTSVALLCDLHAIAWAQDEGLQITTARLGESAA
jgi:hypothetical protein